MTDAELVERRMIVSGEGPLREGEGIFILQGKNNLVVRGMVSRYQMDNKAHDGCEFHVVIVGATVSQRGAPLAADTAIGMKRA